MDDAGRGRLLDESAVVARLLPNAPSEGPDEVPKPTRRTKRAGRISREEAKGRQRPIEHFPLIVPAATISTAAAESAPRPRLQLPDARQQRMPMSNTLKPIEKDDAPSLPEHELSARRVRLQLR
jgi:hypothetical protein